MRSNGTACVGRSEDFLSAERIDLELQVSRAEHVHKSVKAFVIETIMAIWSNACFNTN